MAAFALRNGTREVTADMNITPLVDVMLVLLVIFMLAAPIAAQRLVVENAVACAAGCPPPQQPIRLAIKRTGELYWNGTSISRHTLASELDGLARLPKAPPLELHVEGMARYALLTEVLAAARNAGVRAISVAPRDD